MLRIYCIFHNSLLLCLHFNIIINFRCDYMEKINEHMVNYRAIKGSSHKKARAPCHHGHTNDRKT